jgi:cyclopropane fatty-acyl-phospholipid synthase-like methyltransferase
VSKDYEKLYSQEESYWGSQPSDLVRRFAEFAPQGRALDLGGGEGRDAIYLAEQGFRATMIEQAAAGAEKCANLAAEKGLRIRTVCEDVREFTIAKNQYAIISAITLFQFMSKEDMRKLCQNIIAGLKRGGLFLCSAFTVDDPSYKVRKRRSREIEPGVFVDSSGSVYSLYDYGELMKICAPLRPIYHHEYDFYDTTRPPAHWHGVVDFVGKKL